MKRPRVLPLGLFFRRISFIRATLYQYICVQVYAIARQIPF